MRGDFNIYRQRVAQMHSADRCFAHKLLSRDVMGAIPSMGWKVKQPLRRQFLLPFTSRRTYDCKAFARGVKKATHAVMSEICFLHLHVGEARTEIKSDPRNITKNFVFVHVISRIDYSATQALRMRTPSHTPGSPK